MNISKRLRWLTTHPHVREIIITVEEAQQLLNLIAKG